VNSKYNQISE